MGLGLVRGYGFHMIRILKQLNLVKTKFKITWLGCTDHSAVDPKNFVDMNQRLTGMPSCRVISSMKAKNPAMPVLALQVSRGDYAHGGPADQGSCNTDCRAMCRRAEDRTGRPW